MKITTDASAVAEACARMGQHTILTVDTEFLRETTFWPLLCVIQLASPEEVLLVDALADGMDLAPVFALMANETILKVFHAGRQDIEIIHNLAGIIPHPIFDTQVAAMVLGYGDAISYDQLVARTTGGKIDKSHRFTDWSRRPLSDAQLAYAADDVTHLRGVHAKLSAQLAERGREHWVAEEMAILTAPETYDLHPDDAWQRLKLRVRKPRELAALQMLAAWREREARARNVPRGRVLKDDAIYEIASQLPREQQALGRLRTVSKGFERSRTGESIIGLIAEVMEIAEDDLPAIPKPKRNSEGAPAIVDLLKVLLKLTSEEHHVAPKILANVADLERLASEKEPDIPALHGWRRELFGETALKLKRGELALAIKGKRSIILDVPNEA